MGCLPHEVHIQQLDGGRDGLLLLVRLAQGLSLHSGRLTESHEPGYITVGDWGSATASFGGNMQELEGIKVCEEGD